jgi:hypothetical protein
MPKESSVIKCPNCGTEINVSELLHHQVEEQLQKEFETKNKQLQRDFEKRQKEIEDQKNQLATDKQNLQDQVDTAVQQKLKAEKTQLEKKLRAQISDEKSEELKSLEDELKQKSDQVKDLNKTKAEVERLKREKSEMRTQIEADAEKKMSEQLTQEREKIRTAEKEKTGIELQKRDKLIEDLSKRLEDAQNKLDQGSNKMTGEVTEIALREFLKSSFPMDEIKDVPSGVTGADVIQLVRNSLGQYSGTILYERKETQSFGDKWIPKLMEDARTTKADICVLVTKTMPKDNELTHFRDGVWVCTFNDVRIITTLLRDALLRQYSALASQADKGTKMDMLYNYLIGNDFRNHISGILEAFRAMDRSLEKERDDAIKKFSEREAHIFKAKQSILNFWGRVEGITSDWLNQEIRVLEESTKQLPNSE